MLDDLLKKGEDMVSGVTNGSGAGIVDTVLGMTDLDEKAIAMFDEKLGAGKFEEMKALLADGKISKEEISKIATEAGVPEMMIEMIMKFI
jgi:hypothetical protein